MHAVAPWALGVPRAAVAAKTLKQQQLRSGLAALCSWAMAVLLVDGLPGQCSEVWRSALAALHG
eukprot:2758752-Lingulodinium_polyedra.AAC.1